MSNLTVFGIRFENQVQSTYESTTVKEIQNIPQTVTLEGGQTIDVLVQKEVEVERQVKTGEKATPIAVIYGTWDDNSHESYYPNLADYASLQQDFSQQQFDHLIGLAGWDITSLT